MKRLCVFCGSSPGRDPVYLQTARQLGQTLNKHKIGLVYGGAQIGVMGEIANTVLDGGGEVIGVIPKALYHQEVAHPGLTQLHVVEDMHQRKALMAQESDGFVSLPGGLGTLEEMFETLTWAQLGFHDKPCGVLNSNGYYDHLLSFIDHAITEGFAKPIHRDLLQVSDTPDILVDKMLAYQSPIIDKWTERDH